MISTRLLGILGLIFGAFVWGTIWFPYRLLEANNITGISSTLLTYLCAIILGLPFVWKKVKENQWDKHLIWLGMTAGFANLGYVVSILEGEVMRVLLLFYLAPLWTILFSRIFLNEKLNQIGWVVMGLSLCGAMIMLYNPKLGLPLPQTRAEILAVLAGAFFALSNVISRKIETVNIEGKSLAIWLGVFIVSAITLLFLGKQPAFVANIFQLDFKTVLIIGIIGLGLFTNSLTVQFGLSVLPANQAIIILLSELVFAAISAFLLANEAMQFREWLGGILIVSASVFSGKLEES